MGAQLLELSIIAEAEVDHGGLVWKQDSVRSLWMDRSGFGRAGSADKAVVLLGRARAGDYWKLS